MFKTSFPAVVMSVREPKTAGAKVYATFGFLAGMVNCPVAPELVELVQANNGGGEIQGVFSLVPRNAQVFGRYKILFDVVELVDVVPSPVNDKSGKGGGSNGR